jgi:hypothetical protein
MSKTESIQAALELIVKNGYHINTIDIQPILEHLWDEAQSDITDSGNWELIW